MTGSATSVGDQAVTVAVAGSEPGTFDPVDGRSG